MTGGGPDPVAQPAAESSAVLGNIPELTATVGVKGSWEAEPVRPAALSVLATTNLMVRHASTFF